MNKEIFCHCDKPLTMEGGCPCDLELVRLRMDLAHEEALHYETIRDLVGDNATKNRLRDERDAANNRIKYLESLITTAAKLAGVA